MDRKELYKELMRNPSTKLFYRLIRRNREESKSSTACINHNGSDILSADEQRHCFAQYYEDLSVPKDTGFDNDYLNLTNIRHNIISQICDKQPYSSDPISVSEVENAIGKLNTGKSADEYNLTAEHLKHSKTVIVPYIVKTFNSILSERQVPDLFKTGILTPVLKKSKDATKMDNYRGITVTAVLGKLFEYVILERITITQSNLQFGFTKGLSPSMASLIVSEAKIEAERNCNTIYLATLDSQKAFDVVDHRILLDKLYQQNVHPDLWLIVKDLYEGLTSKVKWVQELSASFDVGQGVRQGGVLSTHFYKTYINDLLTELEQNRLGLHIGSVYVGCPCCADDVALLSDNHDELQVMLNVAARYAAQHRYNIHPVKSKVIIQVGKKCKNDSSATWTLGNTSINTVASTEHLGLLRTVKKENEININERISLARRTLYSLIGAGVHGTNGLNPKISYKIYQTYVIPRLLYGLEVLPLSVSNMDSLRRFHHNCLRRFQTLPTRTALGVLHLLIGALPIVAELHKRQLSLLYSVINCESDLMRGLLERHNAMNESNSKSFFPRVESVLSMYGLPNITELQAIRPAKMPWKRTVNEAMKTYWTQSYKDELTNKSTVKYMNTEELEVGKTHHVWNTLETSVTDVRKGITKARMLTGTYILQATKSRYSQYNIEATCQMCRLEDEDIIHTITRCPALERIRRQFIPSITAEIAKHIGPNSQHVYMNGCNRETLTKLILDSSWIESKTPNLQHLNRLSTELCYKIHLERCRLLRV
ncbi:MAG: reverse transcriptase family protein [Sedimenticola sp.]